MAQMHNEVGQEGAGGHDGTGQGGHTKTETGATRRFQQAALAVHHYTKGGGRLPRGRCPIGVAITVAVVMVTIALRLDGGAVTLLGLLAAAVFSPMVSRATVVAALVCLAACPLFLVAEQNAWLQQSSLVNYYAAAAGIYTLSNAMQTLLPWAFYLLSIGLVGRAVQYAVYEKTYDRTCDGTN